MRQPLESTIVKKVMAQAKALGWLPLKQHGSAFVLAGLPDVLAIRNGRAAWMEVKRPGQHPTEIQIVRHRQLRDCGCPVAVVRSAQEAKDFLEGLA